MFKLQLKLTVLYVVKAIITLLLISVLIGPILYWHFSPSQKLQVWVFDKTVPNHEYREHKGIYWILNHYRILHPHTERYYSYQEDYYGFFPLENEKYEVHEVTSKSTNPDLIYIADTYGVYSEEVMNKNLRGTPSKLIYGGIDSFEIETIKENLKLGSTIIGEFNIAASPTNQENRDSLGEIFGVDWDGWAGRYFFDLENIDSIPEWVVDHYQIQQQKLWDLDGEGYILISDDNQIFVLQQGIHYVSEGLTINFDSDNDFNIQGTFPYHYWFEFISPFQQTEVIASFEFDLTSEGKKRFHEFNVKERFPAVLVHYNSKYKGYYFSGDFADFNKYSPFYMYYGFDAFMKKTVFDSNESNDYFFWNVYCPMMRKILFDITPKKGVID
jgi:hypothetical protein